MNKKTKALTFSFDDGVLDDERLVGILDKYGLKCTFNLNSALMSNRNTWNYNNKKLVLHMNYTDCINLYEKHEIACHGYTHPDFSKLDYNTTYNDIYIDKKILESLFDCKIKGMAYPFGVYDEKTLKILAELGIVYSRGVHSTYSFELPNKLLELEPTCHYREKEIYRLIDDFINSSSSEPLLFYIWGHSYELVTEDDWQDFENICKKLSNRDDIYYCTNIEAIEWMKTFE